MMHGHKSIKLKRIFESEPEEIRRRRTGLRWLEDVEKDPWEMEVKRWREKADDSEEWASVIKGAKALRGRESQEVSKQVIHPP